MQRTITGRYVLNRQSKLHHDVIRIYACGMVADTYVNSQSKLHHDVIRIYACGMVADTYIDRDKVKYIIMP